MARRARRRPVLTLGLALVLALGFFAVQARRRQMFEAEVGLLISEGAFAADGRPRPPGELRAFINRAIFTKDHLDTLVRKHDLVTKLQAGSLEGAKSRLRKLVEIETWHDYFEGYRDHLDPPRSARAAITFSAPDPALASAVVRDIAEIVIETQTQQATDIGNARMEGLRLLAENAAGRAVDLEKQLLRVREEAFSDRSPITNDDLLQLSKLVQVAQSSARGAEAALVDAQLGTRAVRQLGDLVHVMDRSNSFWSAISPRARLTRQIILSLLLAGLAAIALIGALDPTVLDEEDIERAGLVPIGTVLASQGQSSHSEV